MERGVRLNCDRMTPRAAGRVRLRPNRLLLEPSPGTPGEGRVRAFSPPASSLPAPPLAWEGEAPSESSSYFLQVHSVNRRLGRSLALPTCRLARTSAPTSTL